MMARQQACTDSRPSATLPPGLSRNRGGRPEYDPAKRCPLPAWSPATCGFLCQGARRAWRNRMPDLLELLTHGPVVCAEGYLFECERRGYLQAGAFVPEVVLDHPEVIEELHREFVHAGSNVVEAFTYYGHREKLRVIGKEDILEPLNRQAIAIASRVARDTGALLAGNLCNTNVYEPGAAAERTVRSAFEEQVSWAAEVGVDFVIAETFSWAGEALLALEAIRAAVDAGPARPGPRRRPGLPDRARSVHLHPSRARRFRHGRRRPRRPVPRHLLWRRPASRARRG